ncbi:MAG: 2Fe-2S iron-sulfur cluster-binding protein [Acinetobacter sp.]
MGHIVFVEHGGQEHIVNLIAGQTLMQLAVDNDIPGIDADCGGECACGTCHVMLQQKWFSVANKAEADELQMLDMTPERSATSRLSCRVQITDAMDGMAVHLPEFQM